MTIAKGQPWGLPVAAPEDPLIVRSDADLVAQRHTTRPLVLAGGDVHRALGRPPLGRAEVFEFPIDLLRVETDAATFEAAAHVLVMRSRWRGPILAVMNAEWMGEWLVAPRAHPNDGRLDVVDVDATMSWRQRWQARRLLPLGAHLPHPSISVRSASTVERRFERPVPARVDGRPVGSLTWLRVTVEPDAVRVVA